MLQNQPTPWNIHFIAKAFSDFRKRKKKEGCSTDLENFDLKKFITYEKKKLKISIEIAENDLNSYTAKIVLPSYCD